MCPLHKLLSLVSQEGEGVVEHLDDSLLNRLEKALYCEDVHHSIWIEFCNATFRKFMTSFEGSLEDTELSRGKLKIKFSVLWRMRNHCIPSDFEKSLYEMDSFHFFGGLFDSHLPILKKLYQTSLNVNHRRPIVLLFILVSLSGFGTREGIDRFCDCMKPMAMCSYDVDFLVDLLTELVRVSHLSNEVCSVYINRCAENVAALLNKSSVSVKQEEELMYLLILLAPYHPALLEGAMCASSLPKVGCHLRRLLTNGVLKDCLIHRTLVRQWYRQVEDSFDDSKTLAKALTPISTCPKNPLHHPAFCELLPPTFIDNLWDHSIKLLSQNQFDTVFTNCWLLFNRYCCLQEGARIREQLQFLLDQICNRSHILSEFSVLMDTIFSLYSSLSSNTLAERLDVFQRIYRLTLEECSQLKSGRGCFSYSFLLLRIYQPAFLNEAIALQLLKLQKLVSIQVAEDPSLLANETVIEILCGFFITPLLEPQACEAFTPRIFTQILDLVTTIQISKASIGEEQIFPNALKNVLLACFLLCLNCPDVVDHLRDAESLDLAMKTCADLVSAEWEEDPLIQMKVAESWSIFLKKAEKQMNSLEMGSLLEHLRPHFSSAPPVRIGHGACPSCGECIHSLLEDIVLSNQAVGDFDCVGD